MSQLNPTPEAYSTALDQIRQLLTQNPNQLYFMIAHYEGFYCSAGNHHLNCMFGDEVTPLEYDLTMLAVAHCNLRVLFVAITSPFDFAPKMLGAAHADHHVMKIIVKEPCIEGPNTNMRSIHMIQKLENLIMRKERALYLPDDLNFILDFSKIHSNALIEGLLKVNFPIRINNQGLLRSVALGSGLMERGAGGLA